MTSPSVHEVRLFPKTGSRRDNGHDVALDGPLRTLTWAMGIEDAASVGVHMLIDSHDANEAPNWRCASHPPTWAIRSHLGHVGRHHQPDRGRDRRHLPAPREVANNQFAGHRVGAPASRSQVVTCVQMLGRGRWWRES